MRLSDSACYAHDSPSALVSHSLTPLPPSSSSVSLSPSQLKAIPRLAMANGDVAHSLSPSSLHLSDSPPSPITSQVEAYLAMTNGDIAFALELFKEDSAWCR